MATVAVKRGRSAVLAVALLLTAMIFMVSPAVPASKPSASKPEDPAALLRAAKSWAYQLQDVDAARLRKSSYDVLVLDAGSGAAGSGLSSADIRRLKRKPDGSRRVVLAYLSIGEAED